MTETGERSTTNYHLDLEHQKRNVFVTQLNQRDDEDEGGGIHAHPVVAEAAGQLLQSGVNTLQRTLLLRRQVEVDTVDQELADKREEFRQRMEQSAEKQLDLQKKQQRMKDRVNKFEKFIKENEAKRRRAIQKYQQEVKSKEQKVSEFELLCMQLAELKKRHEYLRIKLERYKKFEDYLLRVVEILPSHYLEVQDSMVNSLMMRHRTLSATNITLVTNLSDMSDEMERLKQELEVMKQDHDKMKLSINSRLSLLQHDQEKNSDQNQEKELKFGIKRVNMRKQRADFGQIMMSIDNICEKSRRNIDPALEDMTLNEKLEIIKEHVIERTDVARMAAPDGSISPDSNRKSQRKHHKKRAHFQE